jgi:hypothetical protein
MLVIDDLLALPFRGFSGLFRKIAEVAEEEYTDTGKVKDELLHAQMLFETDQMTEEQYQRAETRLMRRLEEIRQYNAKQL